MDARLKGWMILLLLLGTIAVAIAEEITLTTYYPSPRGVYNELRTAGNVQIGLLDPPAVGLPGPPRLHLVQGAGASGDVVPAALRVDDEAPVNFTLDATPFLIDAAGNVGIGTASPGAKLQIAQPSGEQQIGILIDQSAVNDGQNHAIRILTGSTSADTTAGIAIVNTGQSDNLYLRAAGATTGTATPTGIGIDMNRDSASGQQNANFQGYGMQIYNWTTSASGSSGIGYLYKNTTPAHFSPGFRALTIAGAYQAIPPNDTTGSLTGSMFQVLNAAGTVNEFSASRNGHVSARGGLSILGVGSNAPNPNNIPTLTTGGSSSLELRDTTPTTGLGKYLRANGANLEVVNSAYTGVLLTITDTGSVGIGTPSPPAQKLDVAGQIHATGDICTDAGGGKCLSSSLGTITVVTADSGNQNPTATSAASCPGGYVATGGGIVPGFIIPGGQSISTSNNPVGNPPTGWTCTTSRIGGGGAGVFVSNTCYAVCARQ